MARLDRPGDRPVRGPTEVTALYADLARRDPENPLVNFRLADALLRAGRTREARRSFAAWWRRARAAPTPMWASPRPAPSSAGSRRPGSALERALEVEPGNGQAHYNLGELARLRGDPAEARARYEAALADGVTRERAQARLDALPRADGR